MLDWHFRQAGPERKECDMNWDVVEGNWKQFKGNGSEPVGWEEEGGTLAAPASASQLP